MKILLTLVLFLASNAAAFDVGGSLPQGLGDGRYVQKAGDTMSGPLTLVGSSLTVTGNVSAGNATAATNVDLKLNGVNNKATRIQFQEAGVDKWLMGSGAASENGNFELYNGAGSFPLVIDKTTSHTTMSNGLTASSGTITGAITTGISAVKVANAKSPMGYWHQKIFDITSMAGGVGGGLQFTGYKNTGTSGEELFAGIDAYKEDAGSGNANAALRFHTQPQDGSGLVERMRISGAGAVTIPGSAFSVGVTTFVVANGNVSHGGFTTLGSAAPAIKMITLSTTTAQTANSDTAVAHGLTLAKVISVSVLAEVNAGAFFPPHDVQSAGGTFQYDYYLNGTEVVIHTHSTNSAGILGKPLSIVITYKE